MQALLLILFCAFLVQCEKKAKLEARTVAQEKGITKNDVDDTTEVESVEEGFAKIEKRQDEINEIVAKDEYTPEDLTNLRAKITDLETIIAQLEALIAAETDPEKKQAAEEELATARQTIVVLQNIVETISNSSSTENTSILPKVQSIPDYEVFGVEEVSFDLNDIVTELDRDTSGNSYQYSCYYDQVIDQKVSNLPSKDCALISGLSFSQTTGIFAWTPDLDQVGAFEFKLMIDNSVGFIFKYFIVTVTQNNPPVLAPIADQIVSENSSIITIDAKDSTTGNDIDTDGQTISYSCRFDQVLDQAVASGQPCSALVGVSFVAASGIMDWTPNYTQSGAYEFKITGTDSVTSHARIFTITVNQTDAPPVLNTLISQAINELASLTPVDAFDINTSSDFDIDGEAIVYSCFWDNIIDGTVSQTSACIGGGGLTGLSFDSTSGVLNWTPPEGLAGTYEILIKGEATPLSDTAIFTVTINARPPSQFCTNYQSASAYNEIGSGISSDPWHICTAAQLNDIGSVNCQGCGGYFVLEDHIDMNGVSYNRIGDSGANYFTGVFDGQGYTISNLTYSNSADQHVGMFGYTGLLARIRNVNLNNASMLGDKKVGLLVGVNYGEIINCHAQGTVESTNGTGAIYTGGLIGNHYTNLVRYSSFEGTVTAQRNMVGGLTGGSSGLLYEVWAKGTINAAGDDYVGGLVGDSTDGTIVRSFAQVDITANDSVGGLAGYQNGPTIQSYSTGNIAANTQYGGLNGIVGAGGVAQHMVGNLWDTETSGVGVAASNATTPLPVYYDGKNTAAMKTQATYEAKGWDFSNFWIMDSNTGYPRLRTPSERPNLATLSLECVGQEGVTTFDGVGGDGSVGDPYQICTAAQLNSIGANDLSCPGCTFNYILMTDIDMFDFLLYTRWNEIGHDDAASKVYSGTFNGNNHTIFNFFLLDDSGDDLGFISHLTGKILNLKLEKSFVYAKQHYGVGTIVGENGGGYIENISADGIVTGIGTSDWYGGIVGNNDGYLNVCESIVDVLATDYVGGVAGYTTYPILDCIESGHIIGAGSVGGIAGYVDNTYIQRASASGSVSGSNRAGGIVGEINPGHLQNVAAYNDVRVSGADAGGLAGRSNKGSVAFGLSTGIVDATTASGGIVGQPWSSDQRLHRTYFNSDTSGQTEMYFGSGPVPGIAEAKTTASLKTQATFQDWDFGGRWQIVEGQSYPTLIPYSQRISPVSISTYCAAYQNVMDYTAINGDGSSSSPYEICTIGQMLHIASSSCTGCAEHYKLMTDLDYYDTWPGKGRVMIGTVSSFTGGFDGNGYQIYNLSMMDDGGGETALFGSIPNAASVIKNLHLRNSFAFGTSGNTALLVGNLSGAITNCSASGVIVDTSATAGRNGGLVGEMNDGTNPQIASSFTNVVVLTHAEIVGGLCGNCVQSGSITNSYALGTVWGDINKGGLVGYLSVDATHNYAAVKVLPASTGTTGGFVGATLSGTYTKNYWDSEVSGFSGGGSANAYEPRATSQMQSSATFNADWNFGSIWMIDEGTSYPYHQ